VPRITTKHALHCCCINSDSHTVPCTAVMYNNASEITWQQEFESAYAQLESNALLEQVQMLPANQHHRVSLGASSSARCAS
jgi:hypothetical protein